MTGADAVLSELVALGGAGAEVVHLDSGRERASGTGAIRIGVHSDGPQPEPDIEAFDILLTTSATAPRPWVGTATSDALAQLQSAIAANPVASAVAAQALRASLDLSFDAALVQESLAYSMLLGSAEFRRWRESRPRRAPKDDGFDLRVVSERKGSQLDIHLNRPEARNAFDARMRDELFDALVYARDTDGIDSVLLRGNGPSFSAGGDLDEFGLADDVGIAHLIRTLRAPARVLHALGPRGAAELHGACIGAGIEVPSAAAHVTARDGSLFRLPEVSMGLIPGAGGTVTIPRRIGRHRACYMALSGNDIDLATALSWGLVDARAVS